MTSCPKCGESRFVKTSEDYLYTESGLSNVVLANIDVFVCEHCANKLVEIPRIAKLHRAIAYELVKQKERLRPEEIRFLRQYLGRSSTDFADLMGVEIESVSRWENGKVQMSTPHERFLRLMVMHEEPTTEYPLDELKSVAEAPPKKGNQHRLVASGSGWVELHG